MRAFAARGKARHLHAGFSSDAAVKPGAPAGSQLQFAIRNYFNLKRTVCVFRPPLAEGLNRHWRSVDVTVLLKTPAGVAETIETLVTAPDGAMVMLTVTDPSMREARAPDG